MYCICTVRTCRLPDPTGPATPAIGSNVTNLASNQASNNETERNVQIALFEDDTILVRIWTHGISIRPVRSGSQITGLNHEYKRRCHHENALGTTSIRETVLTSDPLWWHHSVYKYRLSWEPRHVIIIVDLIDQMTLLRKTIAILMWSENPGWMVRLVGWE